MRTKFHCGHSTSHVRDRYFLVSGDRVRLGARIGAWSGTSDRHGWIGGANGAMAFGGLAGEVEITHDDGAWHAYASLVDRSPDDLDFLELFHAADPYFTLRFPDDSEIWVKVGDISDLDRIELVEY